MKRDPHYSYRSHFVGELIVELCRSEEVRELIVGLLALLFAAVVASGWLAVSR